MAKGVSFPSKGGIFVATCRGQLMNRPILMDDKL